MSMARPLPLKNVAHAEATQGNASTNYQQNGENHGHEAFNDTTTRNSVTTSITMLLSLRQFTAVPIHFSATTISFL
jgi:hypothetical protein